MGGGSEVSLTQLTVAYRYRMGRSTTSSVVTVETVDSQQSALEVFALLHPLLKIHTLHHKPSSKEHSENQTCFQGYVICYRDPSSTTNLSDTYMLAINCNIVYSDGPFPLSSLW